MPVIDATTYRSPNSAPRTKRVTALVIHHGTGTAASDLGWLTNPASKVSSHFYILRSGIIYQLVPDDRVSWHAGVGKIGSDTDPNAVSLGVELEHTTNPDAGPVHHDWPPAQLDSLAWLCRLKMARYQIPESRVVSHRAVATPAGRKTDPGPEAPMAPEPAFRAWVAGLDGRMQYAPTAVHGLVLTHATDLDMVEDAVVAGGLTTLKIVTAWGLPDAWTDATRARTCALTDRLIIRTHAGDPSSGKPYPHRGEILSEIAPWYAIKRHNLLIEIANEPNSDPAIDPAGFAWHLEQAIDVSRFAFPRARLIAPALILDRGAPERWLSSPEFATAIRRCDLLGVHAYAYRAFDDTGQFATIDRLYAPFGQPLALTEYGINDPGTSDAAKGRAYAALVQGLPGRYALATAYHLDSAAAPGSNAADYAIGADGWAAYGARMIT